MLCVVERANDNSLAMVADETGIGLLVIKSKISNAFSKAGTLVALAGFSVMIFPYTLKDLK